MPVHHEDTKCVICDKRGIASFWDDFLAAPAGWKTAWNALGPDGKLAPQAAGAFFCSTACADDVPITSNGSTGELGVSCITCGKRAICVSGGRWSDESMCIQTTTMLDAGWFVKHEIVRDAVLLHFLCSEGCVALAEVVGTKQRSAIASR